MPATYTLPWEFKGARLRSTQMIPMHHHARMKEALECLQDTQACKAQGVMQRTFSARMLGCSDWGDSGVPSSTSQWFRLAWLPLPPACLPALKRSLWRPDSSSNASPDTETLFVAVSLDACMCHMRQSDYPRDACCLHRGYQARW